MFRRLFLDLSEPVQLRAVLSDKHGSADFEGDTKLVKDRRPPRSTCSDHGRLKRQCRCGETRAQDTGARAAHAGGRARRPLEHERVDAITGALIGKCSPCDSRTDDGKFDPRDTIARALRSHVCQNFTPGQRCLPLKTSFEDMFPHARRVRYFVAALTCASVTAGAWLPHALRIYVTTAATSAGLSFEAHAGIAP